VSESECKGCGCVLPKNHDACGLCGEILSLREANKELGKALSKSMQAKAELRRELDEAYQRAWDAVNAFVKHGELQGNGCDESAQRNGLILATNVIMELKSNATKREG
jgi:hypothetical protein